MKRSTTKILIVTPYFPPSTGGLERYAGELAKHLKSDHKWKVVVLTTSKQKGVDEKKRVDGLTIYRLGYQFKCSNTPFSFDWFLKIRKILKTESPNIINIHTPVPGIGDIVSVMSKNTPIVVTYHTGTMLKGRIPPDIFIWLYEHFLLPLMLRKAKNIVCSSDFVRFGFLHKYLDKSKTITPGTDIEIFKPDSAKKSNNKTVLFLAGLGRADQHKGLSLVIDAINSLHESMPDIRLVVVGDGNMRGEYEDYVRKCGLNEWVKFKGNLFGNKLVSAYQNARVFALPSINDSYPTAIIEAMACGLPVVSTSTGSIPSLVDDGKTGFLVAPNDFEALTSKLKKVLNIPKVSTSMGKAGRIKVSKGFSWVDRSTEHNQLFNRIISPKPLIVQLVSYFPPHVGGMETVVQEISTELSKNNYPVKVFTSNVGAQGAPHKETSPLLEIERLRSVEIAHTPIIWALPFKLFCLPKGSVLHVHIAQAGLPEVAMLIAKIKHFPYIAHFHLDVDPSSILGNIFLLYKKFVLGHVLRAANKVIVFSEEQSKLVQKLYNVKRNNLMIVPNGVGKDFFYNGHRKAPGKKLRVLFVGRLTIQKRVDRLIESMSYLKFPVELKIIGDGEDRKKLENLVVKLKLNNIVFEGEKYGKRLRSYYKNADVLAIPSDKEGMPLVVLEGMAAGLPIVGSNVLGIRELVKNVGILVDNPSGETFATALTNLYINSKMWQKLSIQSRKKAEQFSWSNIVTHLEQSYIEIQRTNI